MTAAVRTREGYLPVPGGMIWYRWYGPADGRPLLVVHGGPGSASEYLMPLAELAGPRPVVFYDQLGCGRSETPDDPGLWRMDRFVEELRAVRQGLGITELDVYGHSWGGWLVLEYLLGHPDGVHSAVLASTSASVPQHREQITKLRKQMPPTVGSTLDRHEGDYDHAGYRAALLRFYERHLCRLTEWPPVLLESMRQQDGNAAYRAMLGPNELVLTGNLAEWDRTDRLNEITVPTLVTVGRFDEVTPACAQTLCRGIPGARLVTFERSAHMPHLEETAHYLDVLGTFLEPVPANDPGDNR